MLNIYRASAGSGKTHRLTGDYIQLLFANESDKSYRRILAVTFTNKATDEMKTRIVEELYTLSTGGKSDYRKELTEKYALSEEQVNKRAHKLLVSILHDFSSFSISTIDRFFQQVVRAFAREIGVNGSYNLELDTDNTLQQSIDNLFLELHLDENKQLLQWLTQFAEDRVEQSENWNPRREIEELGKEIFKENYQNKAKECSEKLHDREFLKNYQRKLRQISTAFETKTKNLSNKLIQQIAQAGLRTDDFKYGKASGVNTLHKLANGNFDDLGKRFYDIAEDISNCYTAKKTPQEVISAIENIYSNGFQSGLQQLIAWMHDDIIEYNSATIVLKYLNTFGILTDLALHIKQLLDEQNTMLLADTNMLLNRIIDNSDTPFVYEKTGINIEHFMIDEFQDTSLLQWKNFRPLITNSLGADNYNLVVGDVKQSIYRWRNSDWKLLDEEVKNEFREGQFAEINLDTNWRSDTHIVEFNNAFFRMASLQLQNKLNLQLDESALFSENSKLRTRIEHAYSHLEQKVSERAKQGYVEIQFIDDKDAENGWKEESLQKLPALLEDLQDRGYDPCDVAILVRVNNEARAVTEKLLGYKTSPHAREGYSYNVMGSEGLQLTSASSVRFIVALLKLILNPADNINRTILNYEYARANSMNNADESLSTCFNSSTGELSNFSHLFSDEQNNALNSIKNTSVYELVEQIIQIFNLNNWHYETAFIQGFQDMVFKFSTNKYTDINSFVKWWDKTGHKQSISTPENTDAFRVMTVHKSKGLDFKAVIIPFCDWDFEKSGGGSNKTILWTEPIMEPYNELPLIPVVYNSKLGKSIFAAQYFDEMMHQYIDNLNVAYVAFTRAKHELYCFAPRAGKELKSIEQSGSLAQLMQALFSYNESEFRSYYNEDDTTLKLGTPSMVEKSRKEPAEKGILLNYASTPANGRLRLRSLNSDQWLQEQEITDSKLSLGNVMHELLQHIQVKEDASKEIGIFVRDGKINTTEAAQIQQMLEQFWQKPETDKWFSHNVKILNEAMIISPNTKLYRPDRVVIDGQTATVIDYKFGEIEKDSYQKQVKNYMQLIKKMGYNVKGYLCYITLDKICEIS